MLDVSQFLRVDNSLNLSKLTKSKEGKNFLKEAIVIFGTARPAQLAYRAYYNISELPVCKVCNKQLTDKNFIDFKRGYRTYCSNSCASRRSSDDYKKKLVEFSNNLILHDKVINSTDIVNITNINCNHDFKVIYRNIFTNDNYCPICGGKQRAQSATNAILKKSKEELERLLPLVGTNYSTYLKVVRILTNYTYIKNIDKINPNRLILSRYSFNLDHIVPIKECYRNLIDVYTASNIENLSIILAKENLSKKDKMTPEGIILLNKWLLEGKIVNSNSHNINQLFLSLNIK